MKKSMIMLFVCVLLAGVAVRAEEISKERMELAAKLMSLMEVDKRIPEAFKQIRNSLLPGMMREMNIPPQEKEKVRKFQDELFDIYEKEFAWEKLKDDYIRIYAATFDEKELQGLVDFYNSPLGKKITAKQPELMKQSMQVMQKQIGAIMPKIKQKVEELNKAEMQKRKKIEN
jgi:hypothetical protein